MIFVFEIPEILLAGIVIIDWESALFDCYLFYDRDVFNEVLYDGFIGLLVVGFLVESFFTTTKGLVRKKL